jgi:nitrate/nitrite transport system permease protein
MSVPVFVIAGRNSWRKLTPLVLRETFLLPVLGFLGLIGIWWVIALFRSELMPTPLEALNNNLHYILNPFSQKGPGDLGIGWLLLASLRRVSIGFLLGAAVAIPLGFLIGLSRTALLIFNPIIQILRPVSPLAWLPIALAMFGIAEP